MDDEAGTSGIAPAFENAAGRGAAGGYGDKDSEFTAHEVCPYDCLDHRSGHVGFQDDYDGRRVMRVDQVADVLSECVIHIVNWFVVDCQNKHASLERVTQHSFPTFFS